ncbi:MAG: Kelch repeat-containing protein, partial [Promethearchaeota archaeon]
TWIYDASENMWTQVFPETSPARRGSASAFYDPPSQRVILYGGYRGGGGHLADTWAYDYPTNNWTNLNPSSKPTGRYGATIIYDPINERGFMFGGRISSITNENWVYYPQNNSWVELSLTSKPPNRYWHGLAYDGFSQKVILFGGSQGSMGALRDTWTYDPFTNLWNELIPSSTPVSRDFFTLAYVSASKNVILFGGAESGQRCFDDTWAFDYNSHNWNQLK